MQSIHLIHLPVKRDIDLLKTLNKKLSQNFQVHDLHLMVIQVCSEGIALNLRPLSIKMQSTNLIHRHVQEIYL